jgi:hypothetical protein
MASQHQGHGVDGGGGGGSLFSEYRIVMICLCIALGQFQYGYDSAAIAGFQSMPGFLAIFGYQDVSLPIIRSRPG